MEIWMFGYLQWVEKKKKEIGAFLENGLAGILLLNSSSCQYV